MVQDTGLLLSILLLSSGITGIRITVTYNNNQHGQLHWSAHAWTQAVSSCVYVWYVWYVQGAAK